MDSCFLNPIEICSLKNTLLTLLHKAAQLANVKNPKNNNGCTPLHKAAPFGLFQYKVTKTNQNLETLFSKTKQNIRQAEPALAVPRDPKPAVGSTQNYQSLVSCDK